MLIQFVIQPEKEKETGYLHIIMSNNKAGVEYIKNK